MHRLSLFVLALLLLIPAAQVTLAQDGTPVASPVAAGAPAPFTGELQSELESYIEATMAQLEVPGAAVAVVQGGEIVYARGFGVREIGKTPPVTPDTLLMIGSINKSMTSTMAATLVDSGWLAWDTPVARLLPGFAVADPELTERLSVADAFCACTGLPRRDLEIVFNFDSITPSEVIESVEEFPLTAPLGERFQYSNQMYVIGGYAAATAAGAALNDLSGGYEAAMRDRLLNPLGMSRSTFAFNEVLGSGDYAEPHVTDLEGKTRQLPLLLDQRFVEVAGPAGALWSSARDMARYIQMELARGGAPDGERVVSAENLERTWQPAVTISLGADAPGPIGEIGQAYGMGWVVGSYAGHRIVWHDGGTFGFASQLAFLPDDDLGIVILTNSGQLGGLLAPAIQFRFLELVFGQPPAFTSFVEESIQGRAEQLTAFRSLLGEVDPAAVAPFLGRYAHPALGEVSLSMVDGRLIFDAGELRSEMRPFLDESGEIAFYVLVDPPMAGPLPLMLQESADGQPELAVTVEGDDTETYVFSQIAPEPQATPVP